MLVKMYYHPVNNKLPYEAPAIEVVEVRNEGIGGGYAEGQGAEVRCGSITITSNVTRVTAESSSDTYGIGIGSGGMQLCGTITIGGTVYWDGSSYQNDGNNYLKTSLLVYPAP